MMWDLLFAHGLRSELIDFTCIAMLLRIRWQLLDADYSGALSLLLRYPSPQPYTPQSFVHDALYLEQNPTADRGSAIIAKYSGRAPQSSRRRSQITKQPSRKALFWDEFRHSNDHSPPTKSPARSSPKSLEALFQDVSKGIQQRTESWGVAKAVRGAVTEARRNMQTMHYEPGLRAHPRKPDGSSVPPRTQPATLEWAMKLQRLEERNKTLATSLQDALNDLRTQLDGVKELDPDTKDAVSQALSQAESVRNCLGDPSLPVDSFQRPPEIEAKPQPVLDPPPDTSSAEESTTEAQTERDPQDKPDSTGPSAQSETEKSFSVAPTQLTNYKDNQDGVRATLPRPTVRPSLADSGFSWMLGASNERNMSGFVSSASVPPEQARHQDSSSPRGKASPLFGQGGDGDQSTVEQDELLAMRSLRGSRAPL
jgi:TBC1 domain family protein 5